MRREGPVVIGWLTAKLRPEVCPFCFEEFRLKDTPFRCTTPPSRCPPEIDPIHSRVWEETAPLGKVIPGAGRRVRSMSCPACSQLTYRRLCPHCHMELPHTTGRLRNVIFAVIGAKEAGKSHYIAVLVDRLRKQVGPALGMLLEPLDDATIRRYREDFYRPLYDAKTVIRGTVSALADRRVQAPLVFSLTFSGTGLFGRRRITRAVTLVFFDTAGEDLADLSSMATVNKYIVRSDGVILLLDPLQLRRVRDRLDGSTPLPTLNTETADIITRTCQLITTGRRLRPDAMLTTPLAVAFSKFDAVEPLVDAQLQLHASAHHDGGFDKADFDAVNAEMQALLEQWESDEIYNQVRTRFRHFGFFGLTALGCNPHADQQVPRVLPRRVEDPFLWLLYQHRLLRAARQRGR
jgi:hypothetical protein